jgi:hypothetical protein
VTILIYVFRVIVFLIIASSVSFDYASIPDSDRFGQLGAFALVFFATLGVGDSLLLNYKHSEMGKNIGPIRSSYLIIMFVLGSTAVLRAFVEFVPVEVSLFLEGGPYTDQDIWLFAADQTGKGLLFDFMEIYNFKVGRLHHNPDAIVFTTGIFIYRAFFSAIVVSLLVIVLRRLQRRQVINYTAPR